MNWRGRRAERNQEIWLEAERAALTNAQHTIRQELRKARDEHRRADVVAVAITHVGIDLRWEITKR